MVKINVFRHAINLQIRNLHFLKKLYFKYTKFICYYYPINFFVIHNIETSIKN